MEIGYWLGCGIAGARLRRLEASEVGSGLGAHYGGVERRCRERGPPRRIDHCATICGWLWAPLPRGRQWEVRCGCTLRCSDPSRLRGPTLRRCGGRGLGARQPGAGPAARDHDRCGTATDGCPGRDGVHSPEPGGPTQSEKPQRTLRHFGAYLVTTQGNHLFLWSLKMSDVYPVHPSPQSSEPWGLQLRRWPR